MRTYRCDCGNTLFFESFQCLQCRADVGLCEACGEVTSLKSEDNTTCCVHCKSVLCPCSNRHPHSICNVWTKASESPQTPETLCRYCRLTTVIPDLSVAGNVERWRVLEKAKRRVLVGVRQARFPADEATWRDRLPLTFQFQADAEQPVSTGHANGCITINIREADPVERERTRVAFGEPQRTLAGHFRHELSHYYWDLLVKPARLKPFRACFGDEREPAYNVARENYYASGPPADWQSHYISAYATMHPWEDFAETMAAYLDMRAAIHTGTHFGIMSVAQDKPSRQPALASLITAYQQLGIVANELNRDLGLIDLVPEIFNEAVTRKLDFVHNLTSTQRR